MYYQSRGVILKSRDFKDSDKLLSIFTEKDGKVKAIAKGVKKPKSSLRSCVQPFCHSFLYLNRGREMDLITQGRLLDFYGNSRQDLERALHCLYLMELLDKSLLEHVPLPGLYHTLINVLKAINEQELNPLYIRYFETQLLVHLGYQPVLRHCVKCGQQLDKKIFFDLAEGGLTCLSCSRENEYQMVFSGETLGLLRFMTEGNLQAVNRIKASPAGLKQLELFLEKYLEYHLDRRFKTKNTISLMKKNMVFPN
ncbi:Recombination protein O, RecO [Syntrophomonas zehnderi OL-4]|uniref:DNA repair protein RecO n=1 Tax=Syntrophomonas zehnderi OL-4 TaxID=690567 RepID=A0A0E3W3R5_9FIRM|nr:DNA repair protein RecO [Syntrophomonas zehnderi]CFY00653.1 Recombination protein O, RecO [Syntrophomonas zehnderi OL-4]